ncbi:MAG: TonB family protein [Terriglobales bacterium]
MAFRALLFSRNSETNAALANACVSAGIHVEVCNDIFTAIKKATQQSLSCLLVDWSDQPDAGFLLKRARESGPNQSVVAIAIVEKDPTAAEMRDHRLEFVISRPIVPEQSTDVLAKASQKMQPAGDDDLPEIPQTYEQPLDAGASTAAVASAQQDWHAQRKNEAADVSKWNSPKGDGDDAAAAADEGIEIEEPEHPAHDHSAFQRVCAVAVVLATAFVLWSTRDAIMYLARTPEGTINVLRESVASLFALPSSDPVPVHVANPLPQQDEYAANSDGSPGPAAQIRVAETESDLSGSHIELRKAPDFPQPTPVYDRPAPEPVPKLNAVVPESLRGSLPITPPVVVTPNPAQMMPVSAPMTPPVSTQSFSEPVPVSEEAERALLIQSVQPEYPPEALAQKLHGTVVLQAIIGRDGRIEDLKIVRGYFVLGKAAIDAVKQWRFQPYSVNGRPAQTQTNITINFSYPTS